MKTTLPGLLIFLGATLGPLHAQDRTKLVADFDTDPPNNVGGNFGAFSPVDTEQIYICRGSPDESIRHGTAGASLRLDYNVSKGGSYNGFWVKLGPSDSGNNFDATAFSRLTFWVKGDDKSGIPNKLKIELKGDPGTPVGKKYVGDIDTKWKKIEISLKDFDKVNPTKLNEIVFVFEQRVVGPQTTGAIYIDDLAFER